MNSDKPSIINYGSSWREEEENFDNLYCESSQPIVHYHEYGSQDSNNVETKMNLQVCIGKNRCLHDAGKTQPPRKAAAAAAVEFDSTVTRTGTLS